MVGHPQMTVCDISNVSVQQKVCLKTIKSTPYVKIHVTQYIYSVSVSHFKSQCLTQENCHNGHKMCFLLFWNIINAETKNSMQQIVSQKTYCKNNCKM